VEVCTRSLFPVSPTNRGLRIAAIENLPLTRDMYDAIDLSDNSLPRLENVPLLRRLRTLLLANNRLSGVERGLGLNLPALDMLVLDGNQLAALGDVCELGKFASLAVLSLRGNPVSSNPLYRQLCVHVCRSLRLLDGAPVTEGERAAADKHYAKKGPKAQLAELRGMA